jgi:hypothetical protein
MLSGLTRRSEIIINQELEMEIKITRRGFLLYQVIAVNDCRKNGSFEAGSVVAINLSAVLPNDREGRNNLIKQKRFL